MKRYLLLFVIILLFDPFQVNSAVAQTTLTFNIDLKEEMRNGIFMPERGDIVELTGDLTPLSRSSRLRMRDLEPIDSVFTVTVPFSQIQEGNTLSYNYVLKVDNQTLTESVPRRIRIREGQIEAELAFFDKFSI